MVFPQIFFLALKTLTEKPYNFFVKLSFFHVYIQPPSMVTLLQQSDLAICAGETSARERWYMKLPIVRLLRDVPGTRGDCIRKVIEAIALPPMRCVFLISITS